MAAIKVGSKAPVFKLPEMGGTIHALEAALTKGPVLLAFFKVECPTCQFAVPFIDRLYRQFQGTGASVWGISQDDAAASRDFASEFSASFPILIDKKPYEVSKCYGIEYTPTLFLIDTNAKVRLTGDGFSKGDLLDAQKWLSQASATAPGELFLPHERVPEFKPG